MNIVKERIGSEMGRKGLNKKKLCEKSGIKYDKLCRFLNRPEVGKLDTLYRIANALEVEPFYLLMPFKFSVNLPAQD